MSNIPAASDQGPLRGNCLCLYLRRAARAVARHFDEAFRPLNLTNGQFSLMMSINRPEPPTIGAVSEVLAMDRTTLTANLKPLERRGLVTVSVDETDRRSRRIALAPAGQALLEAAIPIWRQTHDDVERLLDGDADDLRAALLALGRTGDLVASGA